MSHEFCAGYSTEPFASLVAAHPGTSAYPKSAFRVEWGPIFHRGRLDGSARVLVVGQDPAAHECVVRRILVGEAGQRVQGFLAKLGYTKSYAMVNALLYGVYGQGNGEKHKDDPAIVAYRDQWLAAFFGAGSKIEIVLTLGAIAREAWKDFTKTPAGSGITVAHAALAHPTKPEGMSHGDPAQLATETKKMLGEWSTALTKLAPAAKHPDVAPSLTPYADDWKPGDRVPIPERDFPAGMPGWMRSLDAWAVREGADAKEKRRTLVVRVPEGET